MEADGPCRQAKGPGTQGIVCMTAAQLVTALSLTLTLDCLSPSEHGPVKALFTTVINKTQTDWTTGWRRDRRGIERQKGMGGAKERKPDEDI